MKYTKLGEINIPCIAIGTWSWGNGENGSNDVFGNDIKDSELKNIFDTAMKSGFNLFDTAFVYGMGEAEKNLGSFIKNSDKKVIVSFIRKVKKVDLLTGAIKIE